MTITSHLVFTQFPMFLGMLIHTDDRTFEIYDSRGSPRMGWIPRFTSGMIIDCSNKCKTKNKIFFKVYYPNYQQENWIRVDCHEPRDIELFGQLLRINS